MPDATFGQPTGPANTPTDSSQPTNKYITVPVPQDGTGSASWWWTNIERDEKLRDKFLPNWKQNLRRYRGARPGLFGIPGQETVTVNIDFANTEAKKAQLFYQTPELQLAAQRASDVQIQPLAQAVINAYLTHEIDAMATVDEVLMDVVCPSGIGFVKIGYQAYEGPPIQQPKMANQPVRNSDGYPVMDSTGQMQMAMQPVMDAMGQPIIEEIPNIVREEWCMDRFSPAKGIVPASFDGSDYDKSPYLGMRFMIPVDECKARYGVVPQVARIDEDKYRLNDEPETQTAQRMVSGVEIWYRSNAIREDVADPERFTQLVLATGRGNSRQGAEVLVHRDSPYQELDKRGRYVRGMRGNPINPLTIRYTSDSAYPASDCAMSRSAVDELSMCRSQMIRQRRRNLPMRGIDISRDPAGKETAERIEKGTEQSVIPFNGPPNEIMGVIAPANLPPENFKFNEIIERDIARLWALGANQNGAANDASSATEAQIMQHNTDTRMAKERGRVLTWYVRCAEKLFSLLQMFADETQFVEMLDPQGATQLVAWNKQQIGGMFRFSARPDSSIRIDAAAMRELALRFYNLFANDPNVKRLDLDRWVMAQFPDMDPSRFLNDQPPQPAPEKPSMSLSMKIEDFYGPGAPVAFEILKESGVQVSDIAKTMAGVQGVEAQAQAQQDELIKHPKGAAFVPHPGHVNDIETIDQHAADRTAKRPGRPVSESMMPS